MKRHAPAGLPWGCPYPAVGMQRALDLGDRLAQEVDQRVVDARVLDASGREQKFHAASPIGCTGLARVDGQGAGKTHRLFRRLGRNWLAGGRFAAERLREALEQLQHFGLLLGLPAFEELFELPAACVVNRCRRGDAGFAQHEGAGRLSRSLDQTLVREVGQQRRDACLGEIGNRAAVSAAVKGGWSSSRSRSQVALGPSCSPATSATRL